MSVSIAPLEILTTSKWERVLSAAKVFILCFVIAWPGLILAMRSGVGPRVRFKIAVRIATVLTVPLAGYLAWRRFAGHIHTVRFTGEQIDLVSGLKTVDLDPLDVQGVLGVGGMNASMGEMVVWKRIVIVHHVGAFTL